MFLNDTLHFRCDMLWSPDIMRAWYFCSILHLFLIFQSICSFSILRKISVAFLKIGATKKDTCALFKEFVISKIAKIVIDPRKGAAPLSWGLEYIDQGSLDFGYRDKRIGSVQLSHKIRAHGLVLASIYNNPTL